MIYEEKKDNEVYFYNVTYDKEKLSEILKELKKYSYVSTGHMQISGDITRFPRINSIIKKRVISFFKRDNNDFKICQETILYHKENGNDFVTYDYLFEKLPDIYYYVDMIVNNKNVLDYPFVFGFSKGFNNALYEIFLRDQRLLDEILNYVNSKELVNNGNMNSKRYDYKGLNELYKRVLECLNFELFSIKKCVDNKEKIDGLSFQKKL